MSERARYRQYLNACREADTFNEQHPIATPVRYWPALREGEGRPSQTRSPAWALSSGVAVVSVEGYAGGIALSHVQVTELGGSDRG